MRCVYGKRRIRNRGLPRHNLGSRATELTELLSGDRRAPTWGNTVGDLDANDSRDATACHQALPRGLLCD